MIDSDELQVLLSSEEILTSDRLSDCVNMKDTLADYAALACIKVLAENWAVATFEYPYQHTPDSLLTDLDNAIALLQRYRDYAMGVLKEGQEEAMAGQNSIVLFHHAGDGAFYEGLDRSDLTKKAAMGYYASPSLTCFDETTRYAFYCRIGEVNRWRAMGTQSKLKQAFDLAVKLPPEKVAAVMDAADPLGDDRFIASLKDAVKAH